MGGWVDGHFDIFFDILLKPPQPFTGLFFKNRGLVTFVKWHITLRIFIFSSIFNSPISVKRVMILIRMKQFSQKTWIMYMITMI